MIKHKFTPQTLGIIGGMGPLADAAFLDILHSSVYCKCDQEHIPVLYDGNCMRPDRSDFLMKRSKKSPQRSICASFRSLERQGADIIAIPCNTAHYFLPPLYRQKRKRTLILNMINETVQRCQENGIKTACLLCTPGTYKADLYGDAFFRMGVDPIYPKSDIIKNIQAFIAAVKSGKNPDISELEECIKSIPCDAFVLGCTELSYALHASRQVRLPYIDSLSCLAKKVITVFGKNARNIPYT